MSTGDDADKEAQRRRALLHNAPQPAPRQAVPGELVCEFYSETRKKFYRIELRDRGQGSLRSVSSVASSAPY